MTNHIKAPDIHVWPINFPGGDIRPPAYGTGAPAPTSTPTRTAARTHPPPRPGPPSG
ncbi:MULTISPECIES: hypothetical protein [unclassified Streptomyces]|uniref:hypothetical protein n=1 Tax=Streptomyces sp. NPDC127532 TaxID=3345399 RepID=UPI00362B90C6